MKHPINKYKTIGILLALSAALVFFMVKNIPKPSSDKKNVDPPRPLPELTTASSRLASYTPEKGDIKYRLVPKGTIVKDAGTGWNIYASKEYGFSFTYPADTQLESTESLGYQLPPQQAYKNSRDNFEIKITNQRNAFFILFMNPPNFLVPSTTEVSKTVGKNTGFAFTKQILQSQISKYSSSQIIVYSFEKNNRKFIWYGTFDQNDFESINQFESVFSSTKFK